MLPILGCTATSRLAHAETELDGPDVTARAHAIAHTLPRGTRIALDGGDELTRLIHFLAADAAGCATLFLEDSWTAQDREAVLTDARPDLVLNLRQGNFPVTTGSVGGEQGNLPATNTSPAPGEQGNLPAIPAGNDDTLCYLPTTSGSSGRPKVLARSRRSWLLSFPTLGVPLEPADRVLIPGPLSSSLFLFGALHALHGGAAVELLGRWSPAAAARAARRATVVHLVPAMLSGLLAVLERDPVLRAECALRTVVCGGARVPDELRERLVKALPGGELVEYYGSAEQSLIAVRRDGPLLPVVPVEVRGGELWVRSELVCAGRLQHGTLRPVTDGWNTVGDRAIQHPDGSLEVLGRTGSVIDTGAQLVSAEAIESVLRGAAGVLDVIVTATPHPRFGALVTAVIETDPLAPPALCDLRALVRRALKPTERPRRWLTITDLPRTSSGKPARALISQRLAEGTLPVTAMPATGPR